jgi:hypothetical protein
MVRGNGAVFEHLRVGDLPESWVAESPRAAPTCEYSYGGARARSGGRAGVKVAKMWVVGYGGIRMCLRARSNWMSSQDYKAKVKGNKD